MASLVTDSRLWTYLRGFVTRMNSFVRSVVIFRQQDSAVDLEQGAARQDIDISSHPPKAKMHAILSSLLRMGRQDVPDVDVERGVHSTAQKGCSIPVAIKNNAIATSQEDLPSQSHSISSVLDLMPIPVTTSKERALVASILAARNASPIRYATPPLMSPSTMSSPGTPYFINSPASTALDTPPPSMYTPSLRSPNPNAYSTPFVDQCARLDGSPCDMSVSLSMTSVFETSEVYDHHQQQPKQSRPKRWTGHAGFAFPVKHKRLFCVPEEEDSISTVEQDDVLVTSAGGGHAISNSPWDNGEQESYGLKGKASWTREMKSLGSFSDNQLWIDVPMED